MEIKHIPNRINPYEYNDYGMEPELVTKNHDVSINCYISGDETKRKLPILTYTQNETDKKMIEGVYRYSKEGKDYYTFCLGKFCTGNLIKYRIQITEDSRVIQTKWYEFEVLTSIELSTPDEVCLEEDKFDTTLFGYYTIKGDKCLKLSMKLKQDMISFQIQGIYPWKDTKNRLKETYQYNGDEYELTIEANTHSLLLKGKNEETIGTFKKGFHTIKMLVNGNDTIQYFSVSLDLSGKGFYGFGEKFDRVNQRGLQPKNCVVEQFTHQNEKTYLPVPFFMTEKGYGVYYDTNHIVDFDIKATTEDQNTVTMSRLIGNTVSENHLLFFFGSVNERIQQYQKRSGKIMLPPNWAFGPWMSANGWDSQRETLQQVDNMKKYEIPATVMVLEAWSDEATFYVFNGAQYEAKDGSEALSYNEFQFKEDGKWTNPKKMSEIIHANNMKLILWQIPVIKHFDGEEQKQHQNDERTVLEKGYCVKQSDGSPYRITDNWFADSLLLDFNNPEAVKWWFSKREYLVKELHVDGFKTDGGEFVYDYKSVFKDGKTGYEMKNQYPNAYVGSYYKFLEEMLGKNKGITFSRAGYKGAGSFPTHWAGDQVSEFCELRAQIRAGLSAGLSGVFFWGFDIAGFAGELPTTELYLRASAVAAFCPIMQFHAEPRTGQFGDQNRRSWNNDRSPWNIAEVNEDAYVMEVYRYYANLRMNLLPYIVSEAGYAIKESRPLFAHLICDYENDDNVYEIEDEYMFGRNLLVAPILYEGETERSVYLPAGVWYDFFTSESYEGGKHYTLPCKLGQILVFVKGGSIIPLHLSDKLALGSYVGNNAESFENLCFIVYGNAGEYHYTDESGNNLFVQYSNQVGLVAGGRNETDFKVISSANIKQAYDRK
ncbi:MAG: TIM-barrel domain-containing protein [Velocimicrobium sp.]